MEVVGLICFVKKQHKKEEEAVERIKCRKDWLSLSLSFLSFFNVMLVVGG